MSTYQRDQFSHTLPANLGVANDLFQLHEEFSEYNQYYEQFYQSLKSILTNDAIPDFAQRSLFEQAEWLNNRAQLLCAEVCYIRQRAACDTQRALKPNPR